MLYPIFQLHPPKHIHHHPVNVTNNNTMNHMSMDHHHLAHEEDPHAHRNIMITTACK